MRELNGIVHDLPEAEYHSRPELSSTGARLLLESPAKFQYGLTHPRPDKDAFDLGSSVHSKVLGTGYEVAILDFDNWRTKDSQTARDEARAAGQIPMLRKDYAPVNDIAEAVLAQPTARALFEQDGTAETSVFATDPDTGVNVRVRFDYLAGICVDLKTARDASPHGFAKSAASYGYDTQEGFYLDALQWATGERRDMVFVAVEVEPPYLVAVHQLNHLFADMGQVKAKHARELFAECTATGIWPGYPTDVQLLMPPVWATYDFEDNYS